MKSYIRRTIALILWIGLLCSACSGDSQVSELTEDSGLTAQNEEAIDAAFDTFLSNMVVYNTLGPDALNEMLSEEPPPFLLDVRSTEEVELYGRIEGAVVIPLWDIGKHTDQLPSFDTTIVAYCASGWRSTIAMTALGALGWPNVRSLKGNSYFGWVEAGYPIVEGIPKSVEINTARPDADLLAYMDETLSNIPGDKGSISIESLDIEIAKNPEIVLIDVRLKEELEETGLIENAVHIPLESFIDDKANWPADKDATIVIYCGSGHRSTIAMTILWIYGYRDVHSLRSGIYGWLDAGYPVVEYSMQ